MRRANFLPEESPDVLFEMPIEDAREAAILQEQAALNRAVANGEPIPKIVHLVKRVRDAKRPLEPLEVSDEEVPTPEPPVNPTSPESRKPSRMRGGSFSSGLKRHIAKRPDKYQRMIIPRADKQLLSPTSIKQQLRPTGDELTFKGVLFTGTEYGRLTFSAGALQRRIGGNVIAHTTQRAASDRHQRADEVKQDGLEQRANHADTAIRELTYKLSYATRLNKETSFPQLSHMTPVEMDECVETTYNGLIDMLQAISDNHHAATERHDELMTTFKWLLSNKDAIADTTTYWRHMTTIYIGWLETKLKIFQTVKDDIEEKLAK